jgi:hypothetical protein
MMKYSLSPPALLLVGDRLAGENPKSLHERSRFGFLCVDLAEGLTKACGDSVLRKTSGLNRNRFLPVPAQIIIPLTVKDATAVLRVAKMMRGVKVISGRSGLSGGMQT